MASSAPIVIGKRQNAPYREVKQVRQFQIPPCRRRRQGKELATGKNDEMAKYASLDFSPARLTNTCRLEPAAVRSKRPVPALWSFECWIRPSRRWRELRALVFYLSRSTCKRSEGGAVDKGSP